MLQESLKVKQVLGNTALELKADPGESFMITNIEIYNPANNYIKVYINEVLVGYFRVGGAMGNQLPFTKGRSVHSHDFQTSATATADQVLFASLQNCGGTEIAAKMIGGLAASTTYKRAMNFEHGPRVYGKTLLELLYGMEIFKGFPLAEGETLRIEDANQANAIQVVTYQVYDPGDVLNTWENGRKADERMWMLYGNSGANINKTGDSLYNTPAGPGYMPKFPFGEKVPAKTEIDLLAVCASDFAPGENDGTDSVYTSYLKFIRGTDILFDEDKNGLLHYAPFTTAYGNADMTAEGFSRFGNFSSADYKLPFFFPELLTFVAGEQFSIYLTTVKANAGQNIDVFEQEIGLIAKSRKVA